MRHIFLSFLTLACLTVRAQEQKVRTFRRAQTVSLRAPLMVDSTNISGSKWSESSLLDMDADISRAYEGEVSEADSLVLGGNGRELNLCSFAFKNTRRTQVEIKVDGVKHHQVYVDGEKVKGKTTLNPSNHQVVIKSLTIDKADTMRVRVEGDVVLAASSKDAKRRITLMDIMTGERCNGVSLSPDGKWMIVNTYTTVKGGNTTHKTSVRDVATGRVVATSNGALTWMPRTNAYYYQNKDRAGRNQLVAVDPATGVETVLVCPLPEGGYRMSPDESFMIFSKKDEGPRKDKDVYEIKEPEDRMNGFRSRSQLSIYDLRTGVMRPLTYGTHNVSVTDISPDGRQILLSIHERRLTERPTSLTSLLLMDVATMDVDTLVNREGFLSYARFSPDGRQLCIVGSPECLGGIGKNVREGQTPNMYDYQLYIMSLEDKKVRAMTRDFNPSVSGVQWSRADGQIYFIGEDRDCKRVFSMNPETGAVKSVEVGEDYVTRLALAKEKPLLAVLGQSLSNTSRLYTVDLRAKKNAVRLVEDFNAPILKDVQLGEANEWRFVTSRGDTLSNGYILPPDFDATKTYPMIVYYYGGCSPTGRFLDSSYPFHLFAAQGYVVLYVNPSGATGFGQEFSARHVNTAGEGVADDIIESVKTFCSSHDFVDAKRVGCIGASYGGFMTQYLQTQTDIFACAISHAGISAYTSYWGEGYWGYSYSEASMANSYPWNNRKLYVEQSPLYNADKIHTPLLFLHGTSDTNVPVGESIQMFTALKLLGRETAFVAVEGQDHHIQDFAKRVKWQDTILAWFAKWLQGDASWWNDMYKQF